jgi:undecaprenyl-diphosphatase
MSVLAALLESDARTALRLSRWRPPRWFRALVMLVTRLGDGWCWIALAAFLMLGARAYREVLAGTLAAALAGLAFWRLKRRFKRRRPCELLGLAYDVKVADRFSFPSGHSATSFAIATLLALAFPLLSPLFLAMAAAIAASRVLLGLHYVSDVVAGAALGELLGALCYAVLLA